MTPLFKDVDGTPDWKRGLKRDQCPSSMFQPRTLARWDLCAHKCWGLTTSKEIAAHLWGKHTSFTKLHCCMAFMNLGWRSTIHFVHALHLLGLLISFILFLPIYKSITYESNQIHLSFHSYTQHISQQTTGIPKTGHKE